MQDNQILDVDFNEDYEGKETVEILSPTKFVVLCVASAGLYPVWWFYKTWRFFKLKDNLDIWPVARAFFGIFFVFPLLDRILKYAQANGYQKNFSSTGIAVLFVALNLTSRLPDPYGYISIFAFIPLIEAVKVLNHGILNSEDFNAINNSSYNTRQIILIIIGVMLWGLIMVGIFMPEEF